MRYQRKLLMSRHLAAFVVSGSKRHYHGDYQTASLHAGSERYRIDFIEKFFGRDADAAHIGKADYLRFRRALEDDGAKPATVLRYTNTLSAIFNHGLKEGIEFESHRLTHIKRPSVRYSDKPVTFTDRQVNVLLGPAMAEFERRQFEPARAVRASGKDPLGRQ